MNKSRTGTAIDFWDMGLDERYLFVRDYKKSRTKPIFLCHMNYTSTQGSYQAFWSKDKEMIAVFDESRERFDVGTNAWVIGYDWDKGRVLDPNEIMRAFASHGGKGSNFQAQNFYIPKPEEIKLFEPQTFRKNIP